MVELLSPFGYSMFGDAEQEDGRGNLLGPLPPRVGVSPRAHELGRPGLLDSSSGLYTIRSDVQQQQQQQPEPRAEEYGGRIPFAIQTNEPSTAQDLWYRRSVSEKHINRHPGPEPMERGGGFLDSPAREYGTSGRVTQRAHSERLQMVGAVDKAEVRRVGSIQEPSGSLQNDAWSVARASGGDRSPSVSGFQVSSFANSGLAFSSPGSRRSMNVADVHNLQSIKQGVICTDVQGIITHWNEAAELMYGWKADEILGQNIVQISPRHLISESLNIIDRVSRGESWSGPTRAIRRDGSVISTWTTNTPIVDSRSRIIGVIGVSFDASYGTSDDRTSGISSSGEAFVTGSGKEKAAPTASDDGKSILSRRRVHLDDEGVPQESVYGAQSSGSQSSETGGDSNFLRVGRTSVEILLRKLQIGSGSFQKQASENEQPWEELATDSSSASVSARRGDRELTLPTSLGGVPEYSSQQKVPMYVANEISDSNAGERDDYLLPLIVPASQSRGGEGGGSWGSIGSQKETAFNNQSLSRSSSGSLPGSATGLDVASVGSPPPGDIAPVSRSLYLKQAEEDFQLQLALALRVTAEAAAIDDPLLLSTVRGPKDNAKRMPGISKMEATAYRYWVSSCLTYDDRIEDGFYEIWGMSPHVWSMCTDSAELGRMPPMENLKAVSTDELSPDDPLFEVVLVDRFHDPALIELEDKAIALGYESSEVLDMASELSKVVSNAMGGSAASDEMLVDKYQLTSTELMKALGTIVLPIGRLRVGLSRHRALLFKVLADSVGLACRLVRGSAFCNKPDDASVIVKVADDKEWMVDLLVNPGKRLPPDKRYPVRPPVIASPLQFESRNPFVTGSISVKHWSRQEAKESKDVADGARDDEAQARFQDSNGSARLVGQGLEFQDGSKGGSIGSVADKKSKEDADEDLTNDKYGVVHLRDKPKSSPKSAPKLLSPAKKGSKDSFFMQEISKEADEAERPPVAMSGSGKDARQPESPVREAVKEAVREVDKTFAKEAKEGKESRRTEVDKAFAKEAKEGKESRRTEVDKAFAKEAKEGKESRRTAGSGESGYSGGPARMVVEQIASEPSDFEIVWEDVVIGERIGQGSFGRVYRGDWQGSDVAVKVFLDQDLKTEALEEFRSEVALMRRLRHPNVVLFMGAVTSPPNLSIITEFCPRGSLYRLLHRPNRELDDRKRIRMALDVAKGMNYLHRCSPPVVHRDLKSPNLLVDKNWTVKVADFGLSKQKHNTFLSSKSSAGTPEWMAPEVLRNEPSDEKSDVYSFGVILWELATLQIPWSGMNPIQVVGAVGFQHRRLVVPDNVDPSIGAIIHACWRHDTKSRPSFADLMQELKVLQSRSLQVQGSTNKARANAGKEEED